VRHNNNNNRFLPPSFFTTTQQQQQEKKRRLKRENKREAEKKETQVFQFQSENRNLPQKIEEREREICEILRFRKIYIYIYSNLCVYTERLRSWCGK